MKWLLSLAIFLVMLGLYLDSLVPEEITEHRVVAMNTGLLLFDSVVRVMCMNNAVSECVLLKGTEDGSLSVYSPFASISLRNRYIDI